MGFGFLSYLLWPFRVLQHSTLWIWERFWTWELVSQLVGVVCVGVGFMLAQYGWYLSAKVFLIAGALLIFTRMAYDAVKSTKITSAEKLVASLLVLLILATMCYGALAFIRDVQWKNEIKIHLTFKSSPLFTKKRQTAITWALNNYYRYLTDEGLEVSPEIPPLGISPRHGLTTAGGAWGGPSYYSAIYIPEEAIDNPDTWRTIYSSYIFNRMLQDNPYHPTSRDEASDDEIAAWIYVCYFPHSFSGQQVCDPSSPGFKWTEAILEVRQKYGQEYADRLMAYTARMWRGIPAKYVNNFDQFFRYKLSTGETVADNMGGDRYSDLNEIFKKHGIDISQPQ